MEALPTAEQILDEMMSRPNIQNKPENPQPVENIQSPAEFAQTVLNIQPDENQIKALEVEDKNIILISTPWAKFGFFYETWRKADPTRWFKLAVPATECPRIPKEFLDPEFQLFSTELIESRFSDDVKAYPGLEVE